MKKVFILWVIFTMGLMHAYADEQVSFTASAPDAVAVGDQFRLSYTITTQKVRDFRAPSIKGFDILMGPTRSVQSSRQVINGQVTSTSSITFTYILLATAEGEYNLPGATIVADGKQMMSNALKVKVLPADQASNNSGSASGRAGVSRSASGTSISDNDLFVLATANKTSVYEQEAILLTYKIYTLVDLMGFDNVKLPDFKGFHSQEVELSDNRKWSLEHYKGRNYQTTVYRQFVLFPQQAGKLTIDAARFDSSIAKATHVDDPFEAFFNGGSNVVEVKKTLMAPKLTVDVKALPAGKPEGFSGGVGEFRMDASISSSEVKTNEAVTVRVSISGTGNLKLITTPEVTFPEEFDVYDPKTDQNFRLTNAGLSGDMVIEYLAIPRTAGDFEIPPVTLSFFDVKDHSYRTLRSDAFPLHVAKGTGAPANPAVNNFTNKEDLKVLNEDIRYIDLKDTAIRPKGTHFWGTATYWLCHLLLLILAAAFLLIYRRQMQANANVAKVRGKKANKIAVKRLKQAEKLLQAGSEEAFYDEVLRALWGYASDKLNIPISRLSKDNVEEEFRNKAVDPALVEGFSAVLNQCELARYTSAGNGVAMSEIYESSLQIISKMENEIKTTQAKKG